MFVEVAKSKPRREGDIVQLELRERDVKSRLEKIERCLLGDVLVPFLQLDLLRSLRSTFVLSRGD